MTKDRLIRFGTRGSALALSQTAITSELLQRHDPGLRLETTIVRTQGDREWEKPLPEIGGKGVFTAELEAGLRDGGFDVAVHSLKDLPVAASPGLMIGAYLPRADPRDALISRSRQSLATLPEGAAVGTSSLRRRAQLLAVRPDFEIVSLRGNVDTRIGKGLDADGPYDAVILAMAGLRRVKLEHHVTQILDYEVMLPAPGQGVIAVQCRAADTDLLGRLRRLNDADTRASAFAERAFLEALGAGCQTPVAALAVIKGDDLGLCGLVAGSDGRPVIRLQECGRRSEPARIGQALAQKALAAGAGELLGDS